VLHFYTATSPAALLHRHPHDAVAEEINAGPPGDAARQWLSAEGIRVVGSPQPSPGLLAWDLGPGETAVLALASSMSGAKAVVDDAAARRCANTLDIPALGTLAVVLRAQQRGSVGAVGPVPLSLREAGLYLLDDLLRDLMVLAGE